MAAAVAGINVRIVDHAAQATAAAGRLPTPGPREPGGLGALQKGVSEEYLLNETQEHLPPACLAYPRIHSSGPCLSWPCQAPNICRGTRGVRQRSFLTWHTFNSIQFILGFFNTGEIYHLFR